jgi:hypothetical protein
MTQGSHTTSIAGPPSVPPVLFPSSHWAGLADGSITVAFRRWKRPTVKEGGTLQSPGGLLSIDELAVIAPSDITHDAARAAGSEDVAAVLAALRPEGTLYRVRFHRAGDDPRVTLREKSTFDDDELADLRRVISRLDWAEPVLRLIASDPAVVSTALAEQLQLERPVFKQRVRRLKSLGLTESLEVGYRLSPRGRALLVALDHDRA